MLDRRHLLALGVLTASACFPFGDYQSSTGGGGGEAGSPPTGGAGGGGAAPLPARALQIGSGEADELIDSAVDNDGNVVLAIRFRAELALGDNITLSQPSNGPSIALVYYSRDLSPVWAHVLMTQATVVDGKNVYGSIASVAFDAEGNIIVGGTYVADLLLDRVYNVEGFANAYLAKLRPDQSVHYARLFTDPNSQVATQVAVRKATGHAFLYGHGNFSITFDEVADGACPTLTLAPDFDLFIAEFDADGTCVRELQFGEGSMGAGTLAVEDPRGDVLITGTYGAPVTFGGTALTPTAEGTQRSVFYARLGANLVPELALDVGPVTIENANLVAARPLGDETILSGAMVPPLSIGGFTQGPGVNDIYVARLDAAGELVAENLFGGSGMDGGFAAIAPDGTPRLYGHFVGAATVGDSMPVSVDGSRDIFVAALDESLAPVTVDHIRGTGNDIINGTGFANGEEILIGSFTGTLELDTGTLVTGGSGDSDIFIHVRPLPGTN